MKTDIVDELFSKYYNEALLYTMSLCRDRPLAEDIVSEAFYRALASADDSICNFKPWLLTVCRNEFLMHLRREKKMDGEEIEENSCAVEDNTLEKIIKKEEYRALYRAISLLGQAQKEAITLFYFSNLTVREISEVTGKSESNIKVLLHRGREELRRILEVGDEI